MRLITKAQKGSFLSIDFTPLVWESESQTSGGESNSRKSGDSDGSNKSLIEQIFDKDLNALPSDAYILAELADNVGTMESSSYFNSLARPKQWATIYKMYITKATEAKNNLDMMKSIKSNLIDIKATNDPAITDEGYVFVHRGGAKEISIISPEDYNRKEDRLVTNAELLYIRANDPRFAFNDKISSTLLGATSVYEVRNIITDAIKLAKEEGTSKTTFANPHTLGLTQEGLKALASIGLTKTELAYMDIGTLIKSKIDTESNAEEIAHAINAIEAQLSPQQRTLLDLIAKRSIGGKADARTIIFEYAHAHTSNKQSATLDFVTSFVDDDKKSNKSGKGKTSSSSESDIEKQKMPVPVEFLNSYGLKKRYRFSDGSKGTLFVSGAGLPITKEGNPIGDVPLNVIGISDFAGVLDKSNVTIGGVHIDENLLGSVLAFTNSTVNAPLPIDQHKLVSENVIAPDLELTKKVDEAWRLLIAKGITGKNQQEVALINKTLQSKGLPAMFTGAFDEQGNPILNLTQYARFAVINGIVDEGVLKEGQEFSQHLLQLTDQEKQAAINAFRMTNKNFKATPGGWFSSPKFYKGTIFIPINDNAINAYAGSGVDLTTSQAELLERADADRQRRIENPAASRYKQNTFNINYQ